LPRKPSPSPVKISRAFLEGADDAAHGLIKDHADHRLHDRVFELEIDEKLDLSAARI
jgi:hypothetical protein